ncbi:MAG: proton-conducting transporter membrane subunit [Bacillota bacterium]|nr:proton-conducting transporter membrane subunit [Bacillota bacterium]
MSASMYLIYSFLGLPLIIVLALTLAAKKPADRLCIYAGYLAAIVQMIAAAAIFAALLAAGVESLTFSQFWDMSVSDSAAYLSLDAFSLVAIFCVGLVSLVSLITAQSTMGEKKLNFTNVLMMLMLGMNGIAMAADLFTLYVFLEVTGITSFVLIAIFHDIRGLEGSFKYLVMSAIASAFILAGLAFLFMEFGGLGFDTVAAAIGAWQEAANPTLLIVAFVLLASGFLIKSGIAPFHGWLPDAYQSAPDAVSVVLGGIVTKMAGTYALIRLLSELLTDIAPLTQACVILALGSILFGAVAAVRQSDFKRILAYSSISQIGYILLGAVCASPLGYIGAILHFFNHATFKTTLFVNAAAVHEQTGTTDIEELGGLQKQMPVTGVTSVIAFLSTAGIPPLAGFWSKLIIIIAAWQALGAFAGALALFASIFTAAYFLRLQSKVFFGLLREGLEEVREAVLGLKIAEILLTAITVGFGIAFPLALRFMQAQGWL